MQRRLSLRILTTLGLVVAVLGSLAATAARADSVGTLQVDGRLEVNFSPSQCAVGTPISTNCYSLVSAGDGLVPGLGKATTTYTLVYDNYGSACGHVHAQVAVAGKGEIDLATSSTDCIPDGNAVSSSEATVSGGSGQYTGAAGSGTLDYDIRERGPGTGSAVLRWTGTLTVPGVSFDTTPPQITGATSKTARTRSARGARVRYTVSAADTTDGPLPTACLPKSGSIFRVGRTNVACTAVDDSGNVATARLVVTVKRIHQ